MIASQLAEKARAGLPSDDGMVVRVCCASVVDYWRVFYVDFLWVGDPAVNGVRTLAQAQFAPKNVIENDLEMLLSDRK